MNEIKIQAKEIKLVALKDIKLNPKNRNKHGSDQLEQLKKIIEHQGFRRPCTISNRTGHLVCGEGRFLAATGLGMTHIPVMYQDYESAEQEYADGIADNAIDKQAMLDFEKIHLDLAELGPFDLDLLGIKDFSFDLPQDFEGDPDEILEVVEAIAKLGDIYQLGDHRLMCGDSTDETTVSALMNGEKAELING